MSFNSTELVKASQDGNLQEVRRLVDAGADVNSVGGHGIGPLLTPHAKIVEYLLTGGADPNRQTNEAGDAVLLGNAYLNRLRCVRLLLKAGADPKVLTVDTS